VIDVLNENFLPSVHAKNFLTNEISFLKNSIQFISSITYGKNYIIFTKK